VCTLVLIGYLWLVFLPLFESSFEYESVRVIIIFLTVILIITMGIQVFLAVRMKKKF
jgi:hypothetical protein